MCIYVRGERHVYVYVCIYAREEGVTISLEGEHNSYRRIDWRQLDVRSEVMVGNGTSGVSREAAKAIDSLARERNRKP